MKTTNEMKLMILCVGFFAGSVWATGTGPKGYVITGYSTNANDKKWHDKIAEEAKKDLEAAGYKVTLITQGTKAQFKAAVMDADAKALVFIDHGANDVARVRHPDVDGAASRSTAAQFTGPFNNFDVVTIHACGQDKKAWKDLFPNSDFHSWTASVYASEELKWQQEKKYENAQVPQADNTTGSINPMLQTGQFAFDEEGINLPVHTIGNWTLDPVTATAFGTLSFNFIVTDTDLSSGDTLFSATISGGTMVENEPALFNAAANFNVMMGYDFWVAARSNPSLLLDPGVLGTSVMIDTFDTTVSQSILFEGIRQNIFNVPSVGTLGVFALAALGGRRRRVK